MLRIAAPAALLLALLAGPSSAQVPDKPTVPTLPDVNPRILRLAIEDQWDRGMDMFSGRQVKPPEKLDWAAISRRDRERQATVRDMLSKGELTSGGDYRFAALIFQHSDTPENLGLAHLLAMTAVAKGDRRARWLAAAAFDRHMQALKQPQLFGTQFTIGDGGNEWTMEPYDRTILSDAVRATWCVVPLAEQERILERMRKGEGSAVTSIPDCK